jgi:hypothetical protein
MRAYLLETHGGSYDFSEPVARIEFRITKRTVLPATKRVGTSS